MKTDTIQITLELLNLLSEVDEFKGAWRALGTLAPERLKALRHVATIESIGSSTRIEGSKLTDREVEKLLYKLEIKKFDSRDEQEVAGYAETMEMIFHAFGDNDEYPKWIICSMTASIYLLPQKRWRQFGPCSDAEFRVLGFGRMAHAEGPRSRRR